ncbi:synaptotagmin protein 5 isoform X6, partial [Biomphalaria glabrata]
SYAKVGPAHMKSSPSAPSLELFRRDRLVKEFSRNETFAYLRLATQQARSRSLRNKHLSNNCHSEHTLYYDDVKAMNPRLSRLNNEDSLSVSSLCSDYSQNPKYRSLRKSSNTSELELFRKKGERYSLRRKKAYSTEEPPTGSLISDQGSETVNKSKTEKPVKSSIPHWHETLKKQKAVLATARQLRSQKSLVASKTPEVNVEVNSENDMFPLVKPKIAKTSEAENTGQYLSPNLSKEDYSSSMESISMYVKAAQVSKPNTEGNVTTHLQSSTNPSSQSVSISKAATVMTSTPKAKKNATQLSLDIPTLKLTCPVEDDTITDDIFKTERKVGFYRSVSVGTSNQHFKKTGLTLTFLKRGWSRSKEKTGHRKLQAAQSSENLEKGNDGKGKRLKESEDKSSNRRDSYTVAQESQRTPVLASAGNSNNERFRSLRRSRITKPGHASSLSKTMDVQRCDSSSSACINSASTSTNNGSKPELAHKADTGITKEEPILERPPRKARTLPTLSSIQQSKKYITDNVDEKLSTLSYQNSGPIVQVEQNEPGLKKPLQSSDSFEDMYNTNVNRLVDLMNGGEKASTTSLTKPARTKKRRDLPQAAAGKEQQCLLQKTFSLSEEVAENSNYQSFDDVGYATQVEQVTGLSQINVNGSIKQSQEKMPNGPALSNVSGSKDFLYNSQMKTVKSSNVKVIGSSKLQEIRDSFKESVMKPRTSISPELIKKPPHHRIPSDVSDSVSSTTDTSDQFGEADSLADESGACSDSTMAEQNLDDSFLAEDERPSHSSPADCSSNLTSYESSQAISFNVLPESERSYSQGDKEDSSGRHSSHSNSQFPSNGLTYDESLKRPIAPIRKRPKRVSFKEKSGVQLENDNISLKSTENNEINAVALQTDTNKCVQSKETLLTGIIHKSTSGVEEPKKATLLFLAYNRPPILQSFDNPGTFSDIPDATFDLDGISENERNNETDLDLPSETSELVRDNESIASSSHITSSQVTSSHVTSPTSRTSTPEPQRPQHQARPASDQQLAVPTIAVSNSTNEQREPAEDDDLDDLFSKHRPQLLGSRSSLADSRESIYSVYSDAGEVNYGRIPVTGEIMFHLIYNAKSSALEVHVKQCRGLAPVDAKHNRSDPYVKTYLLPDKTRSGKRKTKIKKHTLNPTFDEILKYSITKAELESRTLWVTVWHNDRFGRNDFLGEVTISLDYYRFDESEPQWYPLQERAVGQEFPMTAYKGDLFISLKYIPGDMVDNTPKKKPSLLRKKNKEKEKPASTGQGEIHVFVKEAQNLTAMRAAAGSNPFCKGYLLPDVSHSSKQKTPAIKKTTNPQWQHVLIFEGVDQSQLFQHGLELTIWDYEKMSSNDFLGGVRLNLGQGTHNGKSVEWMDARGEEVEAWQSMMDHPNEWVDAQLPLRASMGKQVVKK